MCCLCFTCNTQHSTCYIQRPFTCYIRMYRLFILAICRCVDTLYLKCHSPFNLLRIKTYCLLIVLNHLLYITLKVIFTCYLQQVIMSYPATYTHVCFTRVCNSVVFFCCKTPSDLARRRSDTFSLFSNSNVLGRRRVRMLQLLGKNLTSNYL